MITLSICVIAFICMIVVLFWLAKSYCQMIFADYPYYSILPKYVAIVLSYFPGINIGIMIIDTMCRCLISLAIDLRTISEAIYHGIRYIIKIRRG